MDFLQILTNLPHSILIWKILTIFLGSCVFYLFPAAWSYWINQKDVEANIDSIDKKVNNVDETNNINKEKILEIISEYSEIKEKHKELLSEIHDLRQHLTTHNNRLESFIDKVEFMVSVKSNIHEDDDIFKMINKLQQKKRRIDNY